jgi:hypothetical protein
MIHLSQIQRMWPHPPVQSLLPPKEMKAQMPEMEPVESTVLPKSPPPSRTVS